MKELLNRVLPKCMLYKWRQLKFFYKSTWSINKIKKETDKRYYKRFNRHINWNELQTYTEKLNYSKIFCANQIKTELTDKFLVRKWVEEKIGNTYLIPLLGTYERFDDIDFGALPQNL